MPPARRSERPVVVRRMTRASSRSEPPDGEEPPAPPATHLGAGLGATPALETARRVVESFIIAAVSSAGLYLVGTVYNESYYGRLSIDATSLDLAPAFVALQSIHALDGLLTFPTTLLFFYMLYRVFAPLLRRFSPWFGRVRQRFPRLLLVLGNLAVISPLVGSAFITSFQEQELAAQAVVTPVAGVLGTASLILLIYAIWLGWSQRAFIVSRIRARQLLPIALVFVVYLLNALASTASTATMAAERLMTGASDGSMVIEFEMKRGVDHPLAGKELILIIVRQGTFYVVERQPNPPSQRPTAYVIPAASVEMAMVRRLNDANASLGDQLLNEME